MTVQNVFAGPPLYGPSPSKGVKGDLFITYVVVIITSAQNVLDSFACANILQTRSMIVWFILSASPFNSGVFSTVYSNRIPIDRQYSSNFPRYSPPLSARTVFSFWPVSLFTLAWKSLKTDSTCVERQAQHRPDWLNKLRTGSVGPDQLGRVHKPVRRLVRRKGRIGEETKRPLDRYSARNIFGS